MSKASDTLDLTALRVDPSFLNVSPPVSDHCHRHSRPRQVCDCRQKLPLHHLLLVTELARRVELAPLRGDPPGRLIAGQGGSGSNVDLGTISGI